MKYIIGLIIGLIFCLFMGVTGISLGVGAIYPPINRVAQPLLCPSGEMIYQRTVSNPLPGRTYIQASWVCAEPSGRTTPINSFILSLIAGSFYGVLLFVFLAAIVGLRKAVGPARPSSR